MQSFVAIILNFLVMRKATSTYSSFGFATIIVPFNRNVTFCGVMGCGGVEKREQHSRGTVPT